MKAALLLSTFVALASGLTIDWKLGLFAHRECVAPGEEVTFSWQGDNHNVVEVFSEGDWVQCNVPSEEDTVGVEGPLTLTFPEEGVFWYLCGVSSHCKIGHQKAEITVSTDC